MCIFDPVPHRFVYIWDTTSRRILYKLPGHAGSVNEVAFHPEEPIGEANTTASPPQHSLMRRNWCKDKKPFEQDRGEMIQCDWRFPHPRSFLCLSSQCCPAPATSGSTWARSSRAWNMWNMWSVLVCRSPRPASEVNGCGRWVGLESL